MVSGSWFQIDWPWYVKTLSIRFGLEGGNSNKTCHQKNEVVWKVWTGRRSERYAGDGSVKKLLQLTICHLFWLRPVASLSLIHI